MKPMNWPPRNMRPWNRLAKVRGYRELARALEDLVPKLLRRGIAPEVVARDLATLVCACNNDAPPGLVNAVVRHVVILCVLKLRGGHVDPRAVS